MTDNNTLKVGIILGSTRDERLGVRVGQWVQTEATAITGWAVEVLDLKEFDLPVYHEAVQPFAMERHYPHQSVSAWSQKVQDKDAFIIITPEYNHGLPAPLKNALDWLYPEWNDKAAALVGYSSSNGGGIRAVEQLRLVMAHLGVATVQQVTTVAAAGSNLTPTGETTITALSQTLGRELKQLNVWARALRSVRD